MTLNIVALHGFLGAPSDFNHLSSLLNEKVIKESNYQLRWISPDYYNQGSICPSIEWSLWPRSFENYLKGINLSQGRKVLLGYSQGGRLASEFIRNPENEKIFDGVILISSGTGIEDQEKELRVQQDSYWANRFLKDEFKSVVRDWNLQNVFVGSRHEPERTESEYNRKLLAANLKNWSVANHGSFVETLTSSRIPICYISGEHDLKYSGYGQKLKSLNDRIDFVPIPNAGHRCFLDQPHLVAEKIFEFVMKL